jgi:hypothetical protein
LRRVVENRLFISFVLASGIGMALFFRLPFPASDPVLLLVRTQRPGILAAFQWAYTVMLFTTPYALSSLLLSLAYIFAPKQGRTGAFAKFPQYPALAGRERLYVVVGEVDDPTPKEASAALRWLTIPERGLYTGIAVFGAIGSGKTSCCMYPFAEQILAYSADQPSLRPAGLVLEVKGDFCRKVKEILDDCGRGHDYLELSLESG